ncbi:hypothetical protein [Mycoplasmopsis opalescens]|uniref:hypothetical protein n=1 Tax=Mycoplasmopsis opalescens TaxID=114886 RepID=UPI0004A6B903|nr:hypothetical protein [Mycoplasmopsis opalescens]
MKISLICPSIASSKQLKSLLNALVEQDSQDFELILVLSKISSDMYSRLDRYLKFFGSRLKFVVNNKINNSQSDIISSLHLVKSTYAAVIFDEIHFKPWTVSRMIEMIPESEPEIIEWKPRLRGTVRWNADNRLDEDVEYATNQHPEVLAYSYPFIFNKLIKKSLITRLDTIQGNNQSDTKFCLELAYTLLINAKSYYLTSLKGRKEDISILTWFNPSIFNMQFGRIKNYIKFNNLKLTQEIEYAYLYTMRYLVGNFLLTRRYNYLIPLLILAKKAKYDERRSEKFFEKLHKILSDFHKNNENFFATNHYVNLNNHEAMILRGLPELENWEVIW